MGSVDMTLCQIELAEECLRVAEAHLRDLRIKLAKDHAVLCPIRRLPEEVLAHILAWHLDTIQEDVSRNTRDPSCLAPLEVCRKWRDTACRPHPAGPTLLL